MLQKTRVKLKYPLNPYLAALRHDEDFPREAGDRIYKEMLRHYVYIVTGDRSIRGNRRARGIRVATSAESQVRKPPARSFIG